MTNIIPLIAALIGISFGYLEAFIWHYHERYTSLLHGKSKSVEIHNTLVFIKLLIGCLMVPFITWLGAIAGWCFYFYFHQSMMYQQRRNLLYASYPMGWFANGSDSSTSYLDIKFPFIKIYNFRFTVLALGFILYILSFVL